MGLAAYAYFPREGDSLSGGITLSISVEAAQNRALFTLTNEGDNDAYLFQDPHHMQCFRITPTGRQFATVNPAKLDAGPPDIRSLLVVPAGGSVTVPVRFDTWGDRKFHRLEKFQGVITDIGFDLPEFEKIKDQIITETIESSVVIAR